VNILSKSSAQQRAEQIAAFQQELVLLEQEQVLALDSAQRQAIVSYHQVLLEQYRTTYDIDNSHRVFHQADWARELCLPCP
jgi:hypothetical protein